jgi:hypothetical protein
VYGPETRFLRTAVVQEGAVIQIFILYELGHDRGIFVTHF